MGVWVKVARSGATVDGRDISKKIIMNIVNNYNINQTINIFDEFNNLGPLLGKTINIKMETESNGELALYAEIMVDSEFQKITKEPIEQNTFIGLSITTAPVVEGLDPNFRHGV